MSARTTLVVALLAGVGLLAGCGQKGPLVLPTKPAASPPRPAASAQPAPPAATPATPAPAASAAPASGSR